MKQLKSGGSKAEPVPFGTKMPFRINWPATIAANGASRFHDFPCMLNEGFNLVLGGPIANDIGFFIFIDQLIGNDDHAVDLAVIPQANVAHPKQSFDGFTQA